MATLNLAVFLIFITASKCDMLGKGILLNQYNLFGLDVVDFPDTYAPLPSTCKKNGSMYETREKFSYYSDTSSFYKKIGTSVGIQANLQSDYTLGFTLDSTTNTISGKQRTVAGSTMQIMSATAQSTLETSCLYNAPLNEQLLKDLSVLPLKIDSPWLSSSWNKYQIFLKKYGSHVVSAIVYGSSIDQTAFADFFSSYSERNFEVKSCLSFAGPTEVGKANMSLCGGISQDEIDEARGYKMSNVLIVKGGTPETRNELINSRNRTSDMVVKFMNEANCTRAPINFHYRPIWEIIQGHNMSSNDDLIRGVNLEQYYTGYLSYGCTFTETSDNFVLQRFELFPLSSPDAPRYQCSLANEGCHSDDDCHYRWVKCKCQGSTCVRYELKPPDTFAFKTVAIINDVDEKWYWQGCTWKVAGFTCKCKSSNIDGNRFVVWSGDNKADVGLKRRRSGKTRMIDEL